jgi:hypothetical protein
VWSWQSDRLNGVTDLTVIYVKYIRYSILNKVLQLYYTNFISSLAIIRYSYPLLFRIVVILALVVVLSLKDKERGDKLASSINSSN